MAAPYFPARRRCFPFLLATIPFTQKNVTPTNVSLKKLPLKKLPLKKLPLRKMPLRKIIYTRIGVMVSNYEVGAEVVGQG